MFVFLSSCTRPSQLHTPLTLSVTPASRDGSFLLAGTAVFPDGTQLRVQGIRYLQPDSNLTPTLTNQTPLYTILDRDRITVQGGRWQAKLSLWPVSSQGAFQELWQQTFLIVGIRLQPDPQVVFAVNFDPVDQTPDFWVKLRRQQRDLAVQAVQVSQLFTVPLPTQPAEPGARSREPVLTEGWVHTEARATEPSRSTTLPGEPPPPPPDFAQSNAPLTRREQLR